MQLLHQEVAMRLCICAGHSSFKKSCEASIRIHDFDFVETHDVAVLTFGPCQLGFCYVLSSVNLV